jgi:HK97 family phage major capsid protein
MIIGNTLPKYIRCLAKGGGSPLGGIEVCRTEYGDVPALGLLQKANVIGTSSLGPDAAYRAAQTEFLEGVAIYDVLARVDALSALNKIPVRTRVLVESEAPVATWVGEGQPVIASGASFDEIKIEPSKCAGLLVFTKELIFVTGDAAERVLTRSSQRAVASLTSSAAFATDPVADAPTSLLADATEVASTGDIATDMAALVEAFEGDLERAVFVMSSRTAMALALKGAMVGAADGFGAKGGVFCGLPTVASNSIADDVVILLDASGIVYGDDGVELSITTEADVTTADGVVHTLWQENLIGVLATRYVSWQAARTGAVAYLSGVAWAPSPTTPPTRSEIR